MHAQFQRQLGIIPNQKRHEQNRVDGDDLASAIRITIYEMIINYQGYKLVVNYSLSFLSLYGFYRAVNGINSLVEAVFSKHSIDFEGQESTNK